MTGPDTVDQSEILQKIFELTEWLDKDNLKNLVTEVQQVIDEMEEQGIE